MMRAIYNSTSLPLDIDHTAFLTKFNLVGNMIFSKDMFNWDESESLRKRSMRCSLLVASLIGLIIFLSSRLLTLIRIMDSDDNIVNSVYKNQKS
ncbi:hypothetical protein SUGI_0978880 [Cryptomeria japonica]|nr:hypothetical protein SUGI_0978880 [Cryptomeria japonica]